MLEKIRTEKLRVGMYVILPLSWFIHPFLKNRFSITSEKQIRQMLDCGITEVTVDLSRSTVFEDNEPADRIEGERVPTSIVPDELREAINDNKLSLPEKAKAVYKHSIRMIKRLMEAPTAENIGEAKKGIYDVVDLILSDDAISCQLTRITSHDYYTYTHSVSVGVLAVSLSKEMFKRSSSHDMHELGAGFFLHDLGKIFVDEAILNKPGKLTDVEMKQIRRHPALGYRILNKTNQLSNECATVVLQHHERDDGKGYPKGLRGSEIHEYGRICSLADVYDALTSERPYRKKLKPFDALKLMKEEMIHHFQRELFEQFVLMLSKPLEDSDPEKSVK
jgi:HD-GYP domain-containing protein (c-di-GMP phosphodiesterase class II)